MLIQADSWMNAQKKRAGLSQLALYHDLHRGPLIDHVRRRFHVLVDRRVPFPLIDEPVAHAELEAQLFHIAIVGIEVLVMQHPRRHVDGIALVPVIAFTADL